MSSCARSILPSSTTSSRSCVATSSHVFEIVGNIAVGADGSVCTVCATNVVDYPTTSDAFQRQDHSRFPNFRAIERPNI